MDFVQSLFCECVCVRFCRDSIKPEATVNMLCELMVIVQDRIIDMFNVFDDIVYFHYMRAKRGGVQEHTCFNIHQLSFLSSQGCCIVSVKHIAFRLLK